jgi:Mn-dependent DtxR family transcriptional regulator
MVTEELAQDVAQIGAVAGVIWHYLEEKGPVTLSKLVREIDAPRDSVMQGVGWLAREGKVRFEETARSRLISLT